MTCSKCHSEWDYWQDGKKHCHLCEENAAEATKSPVGFAAVLLLLFLFAINGVHSIGFAPAVASDMILYMHLNNNSSLGENSTLAVDISPAKNNGTINGAVFNSTAGILNDGGYIFNTTNSVNIGSKNNLTAGMNMSICAWIRPNMISGAQYFISKYPGAAPEYEMFLDTSGFLNFQVRNSSVNAFATGTTAIAVNTLHFTCGTYNATSGKLRSYLDGVLDAAPSTVVTGDMSNTGVLRIGTRSNQASGFNGTIDEVIMWNRTLQDNEIWSMYMNYVSCISPVENQSVAYNTTFCNQTYLLNDTGADGAIRISGSNVVLDCNGATIRGNYSNNSIGIKWTTAIDNVTMKNCNVQNFDYGAQTTTSFYSNFSFNNFTNTSVRGIDGVRLQNSTIHNNRIVNPFNSSSGDCIAIYRSGSSNAENNRIFDNYIFGCYNGITLTLGANYTTVYQNDIQNVTDYGIHFDNNVYYGNITHNTINNSGWDGIQLRGARTNVSYNRIENSFHHDFDFFTLTFPQNNTVTYNNLSDTGDSHYMYCYRCQGNYVAHNLMTGGTGPTGFGIVLQGLAGQEAAYNIFYNNTILNTSNNLFDISNAYGNQFINNTYGFIGGPWILGHGTTSTGNSANNTYSDPNITFITRGFFRGAFYEQNGTYIINSSNSTGDYNFSVNSTAGLYYSSNGSVSCANVSSCVGANTSIQNVSQFYVIRRFNVTQGTDFAFSPVTIGGSGNTRVITSTLVDSIITSVTATGVTLIPSTPRVTYANGSSENPAYSYENGVMSFTASLPPGVSLLVLNTSDLDPSYSTTTEYCQGIVGNMVRGFDRFSGQLALLGSIFAALLLLAIFLVYSDAGRGFQFDEMFGFVMTFFVVTLLLVVTVIMLGGLC